MGVPRFIKCGGNIYSITPSLLKVCITIANKTQKHTKIRWVGLLVVLFNSIIKTDRSGHA